jgi:transmembrane sensor
LSFSASNNFLLFFCDGGTLEANFIVFIPETMFMYEKDARRTLVERFLQRKASEEELMVFFDLLKKGELDQSLSESMEAHAGVQLSSEPITVVPAVRSIPLWKRISVAAAVLALIFTCTFLLLDRKATDHQLAKSTETRKTPLNDALPGTNKSILTLANGSKIILDSSRKGTLAVEGATNITNSNGLLSYNADASNTASAVLYNTMETPKGGQYQLKLSDGTQVWLNAGSSIRFPNAFSGTERKVEVTGEVYFEVAKNEAMPFLVKLPGDLTVKVLGTHFNINAYTNESYIRTTLLEGSVLISNEASGYTLKPGQQARARMGMPIKIINDVDIEEAVAWKNGMFQFNRADIETIMHQVERWYDVDVVYEGAKPKGLYHGEASRNVTASEMLTVLKESGIKLKIENKKIIVYP